MSDFVPHDLPDLWEEILQRHWTYLETDENMQKLNERKKLEGYLKEFLCIVPHDRKFFLPETAHVLKKSIKEMDEFSAYKAMIGFESISQYANNLFTKPWRKEYRIIKMYSGFYQHEIKSNLVDADKLFEAMGYKQLPNQILMLDGPICPDQVTNVSRDAMAAYVECQIMKQIFSGLTCMQLSCTWLDVFNYREKHVGVASQAVKSMAYSIQERRYHKERHNPENCYSLPQSQGVPVCTACAHQYHVQPNPISNTCNQHHLPQQAQYSTGVCNVHQQPQQQNIYNVPVPHLYKQANFIGPQMSHSKSLEHYGDHMSGGGNLPHRHSFDQPYDGGRSHYDVSYDCVDGYQSCNYNAYNHPYNVSGNRYPLPYNISNQLNNQFPATCGMTNAGHYPPPPPPPPANLVNCGHKIPMVEPNYYGKIPSDQLYGDCNGYPKKPQDMCNYHVGNNKDLINYRQCTYASNGRNSVRTDQLIDFDDRPNDSVNSHNIQTQHVRSLSNSFDYNDRIYDQGTNNRPQKYKQQLTQHYDTPRSQLNITNQTPKDLYNRNIENPDEVDGNYIYNSNQRQEKRAVKKNIDKYSRNAEILEQYEKSIDNNDTHSRAVRDNYGSFEDVIKPGPIEGNDSNKPKSVSNKNQDGVGSFESWDYVFQNLEKHGYKKDLGERGDLLVQGLDLDSMNISNVSDKRRSRNIETKSRTTNDTAKSKTLEKTDLFKETNGKTKTTEKSILKHENDSTGQKITNAKPQVQKIAQPTQKIASVTKTGINNNQDNHQTSNDKHLTTRRQTNKDRPGDRPSVNGTSQTANHHRSASSSNSSATNPIQNSTSNGTASTGGSTGNSAINEWSCRFCTYLNPETKRICEMCCRSRDFNLDANNPPTCV